ncbi:MAG: hypothetical protein PF480_05785 [Roseovarius sp.]|nr:hypothetical protein [Roseovarius sp.]
MWWPIYRIARLLAAQSGAGRMAVTQTLYPFHPEPRIPLMMYRIALLLCLIAGLATAAPQDYRLNTARSTVGFT